MTEKVFVIGNIASGKSTYVQKTKKKICVSKLAQNALLKKAYESEEQNKNHLYLLNQMDILVQLHERQNEDFEIFDRDVCETLIFTQSLYDAGKIDSASLDIFTRIYRHLPQQNRQIVYLKCPAQICYQRLKQRNREIDSIITLEFLQTLEKYYEKFVAEKQQVIYVVENY